MMIKFVIFIFTIVLCISIVIGRPSPLDIEPGFSNRSKRDIASKTNPVSLLETKSNTPDNVLETDSSHPVCQAYATQNDPNTNLQLIDLLKNNTNASNSLMQYGISVPNNILTCNNVSVINVNITLLAPCCNCTCEPEMNASTKEQVDSNIPTIIVESTSESVYSSSDLDTVMITSTTLEIEGTSLDINSIVTVTETLSSSSMLDTVTQQIEGASVEINNLTTSSESPQTNLTTEIPASDTSLQEETETSVNSSTISVTTADNSQPEYRTTIFCTECVTVFCASSTINDSQAQNTSITIDKNYSLAELNTTDEAISEADINVSTSEQNINVKTLDKNEKVRLGKIIGKPNKSVKNKSHRKRRGNKYSLNLQQHLK